jgi:hypothetical protein
MNLARSKGEAAVKWLQGCSSTPSTVRQGAARCLNLRHAGMTPYRRLRQPLRSGAESALRPSLAKTQPWTQNSLGMKTAKPELRPARLWPAFSARSHIPCFGVRARACPGHQPAGGCHIPPSRATTMVGPEAVMAPEQAALARPAGWPETTEYVEGLSNKQLRKVFRNAAAPTASIGDERFYGKS